jgi:hypothetical protein
MSSSGSVVGMCDECDAVWTDPLMKEGPYFLRQPDLPSPTDGSSLRDPPAHWADRDETSAAGWAHVVLDETDTIG